MTLTITKTLQTLPAAKAVAIIKRLVGDEFGFTPEEIDSPSRTADLSLARHVAMTLARNQVAKNSRTSQPTEGGLLLVANLFKRVHHGTVINALAVVDERRTLEPLFRQRFETIEKKVAKALAAAEKRAAR